MTTGSNRSGSTESINLATDQNQYLNQIHDKNQEHNDGYVLMNINDKYVHSQCR